MLPLTTCAPHELVEILEPKEFNVTLFEEIVWNALIDCPGSRNNSVNFGVFLRHRQMLAWALSPQVGGGCLRPHENARCPVETCLHHILVDEQISFDCLFSLLVAFSK